MAVKVKVIALYLDSQPKTGRADAIEAAALPRPRDTRAIGSAQHVVPSRASPNPPARAEFVFIPSLFVLSINFHAGSLRSGHSNTCSCYRIKPNIQNFSMGG